MEIDDNDFRYTAQGIERRTKTKKARRCFIILAVLLVSLLLIFVVYVASFRVLQSYIAQEEPMIQPAYD